MARPCKGVTSFVLLQVSSPGGMCVCVSLSVCVCAKTLSGHHKVGLLYIYIYIYVASDEKRMH